VAIYDVSQGVDIREHMTSLHRSLPRMLCSLLWICVGFENNVIFFFFFLAKHDYSFRNWRGISILIHRRIAIPIEIAISIYSNVKE
jgi:hypothetical protein